MEEQFLPTCPLRLDSIYQRPPPPPPRLSPPPRRLPPPPPPPKLDSRGLASLTLIFLPFRSVSFRVCIALEASSALPISMKPKPFDWPENLSVITATLWTWPACENSSSRSLLDTE